MKIWSATLYLNEDMDGKLVFRFVYKKEEREDYKETVGIEAWTTFENWVSYRVPFDIEVREHYGIKATQGFDYDLSRQEQDEVKENMIKEVIEYLEFKKKKHNEFYDKRIKFIQAQKIIES